MIGGNTMGDVKNLQEYEVQVGKVMKKVKAKNYLDAIRKAGIGIKRVGGKMGRPPKYNWEDK